MVSFIVPAYNEEALLGCTLDALNACARSLVQESEILVVDDASTDRTASIAKEHGAPVIPVRHRQIAAVRNAGAWEARGKMLVFVDADTVVTRSAVRAAVEAMLHGAEGGGCALHFEGRLPFYARALEAVANPVYRIFGLASGCFLFCTRAAFHAVGGFDETLFAAEEAVFSLALKKRGRFVVLGESVTTSGRKLRAYSGQEVLGQILRLAVGGKKSVSQRQGLEIWYGERRPDPDRVEPQRGTELAPLIWSELADDNRVGRDPTRGHRRICSKSYSRTQA